MLSLDGLLFLLLLIKSAIPTRTRKAITPMRPAMIAVVDDDVEEEPVVDEELAANVFEDSPLDIVFDPVEPEPRGIDADPVPREVGLDLMAVDIRVPVKVLDPDRSVAPVIAPVLATPPAPVTAPAAPVPPAMTTGADPS